MSKLHVAGWDPSLRHWGIACGVYDTQTKQLKITHVSVSEPVISTGKQVRQNSKDLAAAEQHTAALLPVLKQASAIFVEVPVGSQSARAMASYALCVGVLGAIRQLGYPFYELTPSEVKRIATGKATATKKEMIDWAVKKHPEAKWPHYKKKGQLVLTESQAEHIADAIATIYAGINSNEFQRVLPHPLLTTA